jgi:hypothetical protein
MYDPQLGRFLAVDPLADQEGQESWTPYHFVSDNPLGANDPNGTCEGCPVPQRVASNPGQPTAIKPESFLDKAIKTYEGLKEAGKAIVNEINSGLQSIGSIKVEGKLTIGAQAGFDVEGASVPVGSVEVNALSIELVSGSAEIQQDGATKTEARVLKPGNGKVKQKVGVALPLVGASVSREYDFMGPGKKQNEKIKSGLSLGTFNREKEENVSSGQSAVNQKTSLDFAASASFIVGYEVKVSFGSTTDKINN